MKILYIPLDERPCNYKYPLQISKNCSNIEFIVPPMELLSKKKKPADIEALWCFVENNIMSSSYAILSLDMLIYGGLLASRLHQENLVILLSRTERLRKLKEINPSVKLYGFDCIMRVPGYSSSEEEPDYYGEYGENIFKVSWLRDKLERGHGTEEDKAAYEEYINNLPKEYHQDYFGRREKNYRVTETILHMVKENIFDYFVIPQDDSALYGVQSQEQGKHKSTIKELNIAHKVFMYPGADEVGCTLLARVINDINEKVPKILVRFSSTLGPTIIPKYEDRPYMETIKSHIISCGMSITDNSLDADLILMVNTPGIEMVESWEQGSLRTNQSHRSLNEFVIALREYIRQGKKVIVADVAYSNGSDLELISLLAAEKIIDKLNAYGGWNTNGNTLGTVLSAGAASIYYGTNKEFLAYRIIEDCGYQALVRQQVIGELPTQGLSYYDFKDKQAWVEERAKELLIKFYNNTVKDSFENDIIINKAAFPWKRMFEIDLDLEVN